MIDRPVMEKEQETTRLVAQQRVVVFRCIDEQYIDIVTPGRLHTTPTKYCPKLVQLSSTSREEGPWGDPRTSRQTRAGFHV